MTEFDYLPFPMKAKRKDRHRAAIAVVCWILHALVIAGDSPLLRRMPGIVGFYDRFRAITEPPIADDESDTPGGEKPALISGKVVPDGGNAYVIAGPPP